MGPTRDGRRIEAALAQLSPVERRILDLRFREMRSLTHVATLLNMTRDEARHHQLQAVRHLNAYLAATRETP